MNQAAFAKEKSAQLVWTAIILGFFTIQGIIWTIAISLTAGDASHAVIPDYDRQSVCWDEIQLRQQASAALGWRASILVGSQADVHNRRKITVRLHSANEQPLAGAAISLTAFHCGHAADVQVVSLSETAPGEYVGNLQVFYHGSWQLSGLASRDGEEFLIETRLTIEAGER
jgi:hypothetical protein